MTGRASVIGAAGLLVFALGACGEKPQTINASAKKADAQAWAVSKGPNPAFMAPGWKAGDKTSWENELRRRHQAQNDYAR